MRTMKKYTQFMHIGLALLVAVGLSSCTTTYDAYGRPVETIDPAAAALGAVAIGVAGYAIGQNNSHDYHHHGHHRPPHRPHHGGHHGHHRRR